MKNLKQNLENFKNNELKEAERNNLINNNFQGAGTITVMNGKEEVYTLSTNGALPLLEDKVEEICKGYNVQVKLHLN